MTNTLVQESNALCYNLVKSAGVSSVMVSFSGSGDSGSIYSVDCLAADHSQVDMVSATALMWPNERSTFNEASSKWEVAVADLPLSIPEILESVTYDALEQSGVDWYNNDGGQGEFTIDLSVDPPGITLGVGVEIG